MFDLSYTTDLRKGLIKTPLMSVFALGDKNAHTLRVTLMNGSEEQPLDGQTVSGYCIRYRDNATVNLQGRIENGQAVVTLSPGCYAQKGLFAVAILVGAGSADETTVFLGEGTVTQTNTDTIVDEENIIPSVAELLAMIQQLKDAVSEANTAIQNANTAAQTANTAAGTAADAASTANGAASTANTAAERANNAAQALEEAPIPTGTVSTYQAGTSPTTPPTGTWQSTVPAVPQGQYLWTRTVQSYTNGSPTTYYSVARQGMDGSGSVASVDGVSPDASGNVPLGAVRSVNGNEPDESGNVTIEEGGGDVQSVNGVSANDDGNVQITGENVNVSDADQRTVAQAVSQHDQIVRSMTAAEFEALTTEQKAALYAQGVRVVAVDGASYLLDAEGGKALLGLPIGGTAVDSEKLGGKDASEYFLAEDAGEIGGGMTAELLYTNPSTSTAFTGLVELDLAGFDGVLLVTHWGNTIVMVGDSYNVFLLSGDWSGNTYKYLYVKTFSVKAEGVEVGTCRYVNLHSPASAAVSDAKLCPLKKVYGLKGLITE